MSDELKQYVKAFGATAATLGYFVVGAFCIYSPVHLFVIEHV